MQRFDAPSCDTLHLRVNELVAFNIINYACVSMDMFVINRQPPIEEEVIKCVKPDWFFNQPFDIILHAVPIFVFRDL